MLAYLRLSKCVSALLSEKQTPYISLQSILVELGQTRTVFSYVENPEVRATQHKTSANALFLQK